MKKAALALSILLLFTACENKPGRIVSGDLYQISTADSTGYAVFHKSGFRTWEGTMYVDEGNLFATTRPITVKSSKEGLYIKGEDRQFLTVLQKYNAPEFKEYPVTWQYKDSVYKVKVQSDIEYGRAKGYWTSLEDSEEPFMDIYLSKVKDKKKKELPLTMDVYMPKDNGGASRPLLVLIHGGGFYNGDKTNAGYREWGTYFASLGYIVASVNYRLGFHANRASIEKAGFRAMQDVNAAIRYMVHNRKEYGVDPKRVFVAGTSAGAITALNVAYMREGDIPVSARGEGEIEAINPDFKEKFSIRGVGSMWGAVNDLSVLDNAAIPIIAFHSTGDPVVPFGADHPFQEVVGNQFITPIMYGDGEIIPYLKSKGIKAVLNKYDLPGIHSINIGENLQINSISYDIQYALRDFFSDVMLPHPAVMRHKSGAPDVRIDATDVLASSWKVDGGVIVSSTKGSARLLLFPDADSHAVQVSGKYTSGLTFNQAMAL